MTTYFLSAQLHNEAYVNESELMRKKDLAFLCVASKKIRLSVIFYSEINTHHMVRMGEDIFK